MNQMLWWCFGVVVCSPPTVLSAQAPSEALARPGLRAYVQEVLAQNAGFRASKDAQAATIERIPTAGALPDPMVILGAISVPIPSFDFDAEPMTQLPVGLQQRFPFPGKQRAATASARADSAAGGAAVVAFEAQLASTATRAYYRYADAGTALAVWRGRVILANRTVAVTQSRYETGVAPQTDLLRARLRRAELEAEHRRLEAALTAADAQLNALRGGAGAPLQPSALLDTTGRPALDVLRDSLPSDTTLVAAAIATSPALRVSAAQVERAERMASVFDVAGRPDFTVTLQNGFRFDGRESLLTGLVGISVPLWSGRKQAPAARAAHLEADAARARHADLLAQLAASITSAHAEVDAFQDRVRQTTDEIVPLAEAASSSALQRYQVGAVEFTSVLDTQDALFRAQLDLARLIADYASARARLAALVGEEWYK